MFYMKLLVWEGVRRMNHGIRGARLTACRNITAPQRRTTLRADQIQTSKVVTFAQRVLSTIRSLDWEEF